MTPADIFSGMDKNANCGGLERMLVVLAAGAIVGVVLGGYELVRLGLWLYNHVSIN